MALMFTKLNQILKILTDRTYALSPGSVDWMKSIGLRDKFFNSHVSYRKYSNYSTKLES